MAEADRWRRDARLARGEKRILAATRQALAALAAYAQTALQQSGLDPAVLDDRAPAWRDALTREVNPAIASVFTDAWELIDRGTGIDPTPYGTRHLESVWNRLVGSSDEVFDRIRTTLEAGRQEGLAVTDMAKEVDALLSDTANWEGRARTIARTEVIGANNAGARSSSRATAEYLGYGPGEVQRSWLATSDGRTRPSHVEADGMTVMGLDTPYDLAGGPVLVPGDPDGPAEEVVNCRCTETFLYPGDPGYDDSLTAGGPMATTHNLLRRRLAGGQLTPQELDVVSDHLTAAADDDPAGVIICALPAESDAVHGIGDEPKHATVLFYGDLPDLPDGYVATLQAIVAGYAQTVEPFTEDVNGIESLGADGARVWMLATDGELARIQGDLPDYDSEAQPPATADQHPDYKPHVTIDYADVTPVAAAPADDVTVEGELDPEVETAAAAVKRISFDRLAVWAGTEQTEYPLTGPAPDDTQETPVAEPTTASGATLLTRRKGMTRAEVQRVMRAQVDQLVEAGFGTRESVSAAMAKALHRPIRPNGKGARWGQHAAVIALDNRTPDGRPIGPQSVAAAAGDPAPVPVEPDAEDMAVGDDAPALVIEPGNDWGPNPDRFHGICTVENEQTGDGRVFAQGAIYWDEAGLPMPLGWQVQDAPGHDGSVICGRIDTFERVGDAITYTGTWDLDGAGWETRRLVQGQFLRGISVDTDDLDAVLVSPDGEPLDMFEMMMGGDEDPVALMQRSRLRSAVLCRVPAFAPSGTEGAYIANGLPEDLVAAVDAGLEAPAEGELPAPEEVVAALVASAVAYDLPPLTTDLPPTEWFSDPGLDTPTPITITEDGRVYGHLAAWGTCHIGVQGSCITPPHSQTDYAHFAHGVTPTTGGPVITGLLTMDTGHAEADLRALPAAAHYDNTGTQFATVSVGEDAIGIWVAGALTPEATPEQVAKVNRAGALSGDWRKIRGNLELVAALAVNTPGFPLPRLSLAASAADGQTSLVAAGIVTRDTAAAVGLADGTLTMADVRTMIASALADERASEARRGRITAASARLRRSRATAAAARIGG